jgi:hypothetical protein|eukprot:SAG25_NODE_1083_length_4081_cov_3.031140_3_plen_521_part_00
MPRKGALPHEATRSGDPGRLGSQPRRSRPVGRDAGSEDLSSLRQRAQRLRERIAVSLEEDLALEQVMGGRGGMAAQYGGLGAPAASNVFGLPPSLDAGLILEAALPPPGSAWNARGDAGGGGAGAGAGVLGQLWYGSRPAEAAGAAQFGNHGAFTPSPQLVQAVAAAKSCRLFVGGLTGINIDPQSDFLFVSFKLPPAVFSPADGNAAGRATSPARADFGYHGAFRAQLGDQSPEQWAREHLVFVVRVTGPDRLGAEGEVLGLASVPLRVLIEAPHFQLHTTLDVIGTAQGAPPAGKLEVRLQLSTDPAPRAGVVGGAGEVSLGSEVLRLAVRLRDLRLHTGAEERALRAASRARDLGNGELPVVVIKIKAFHRGRLEGETPPQHLVRPSLEHFWEVELEADQPLLEYLASGTIVLEVWSGLQSERMGGAAAELLGMVQLPLAALQARLRAMLGRGAAGGDPRLERYPDVGTDTNRPIVNPLDGRECGMLKAMVCLGTPQQVQRLRDEEQAALALQPRMR